MWQGLANEMSGKWGGVLPQLVPALLPSPASCQEPGTRQRVISHLGPQDDKFFRSLRHSWMQILTRLGLGTEPGLESTPLTCFGVLSTLHAFCKYALSSCHTQHCTDAASNWFLFFTSIIAYQVWFRGTGTFPWLLWIPSMPMRLFEFHLKYSNSSSSSFSPGNKQRLLKLTISSFPTPISSGWIYLEKPWSLMIESINWESHSLDVSGTSNRKEVFS